MRRALLMTTLLAGAVACAPMPTSAAVSADINIHVGRRAPTVYFQRAPRAYVVPSTEVYYVQDLDYDMYRFGNDWFINDGGYWFRSRSYRGPFLAVAFEQVPRVILTVPGRYHHQSRGYWQGRSADVRDNGRWNGRRRVQSGSRHDSGRRERGNDAWGHDREGRGQDNGQGHGRGHDRGHDRGNGRGQGNGRGHDGSDDRD
ncbi:MAG: hypothetical protein ABI960_06755 [Candidatus Eisenbacteria bacterium]